MDELNHVSGEQPQAAAVPPEASFSAHPDQDRVVPLTALEAERAKRQQLEEDNRMMREHFALMQAQQATPRPPAPPSNDEFAGLQDTDGITVGDLKKHSQRLASQFGMTLEELRMSQKHPDYQEVVTNYLS